MYNSSQVCAYPTFDVGRNTGGSGSSLSTLESEVIPKKHRFRVGLGLLLFTAGFHFQQYESSLIVSKLAEFHFQLPKLTCGDGGDRESNDFHIRQSQYGQLIWAIYIVWAI